MELLGVLNLASAEEVKGFVDGILPTLESYGLEVIESRTGILMLPMYDQAQGARFFVGELLVAEAKVKLRGTIGYSMCLGRDREHALATAILDAAVRAGLFRDEIVRFAEGLGRTLKREEEKLLRTVEATRVEMENF